MKKNIFVCVIIIFCSFFLSCNNSGSSSDDNEEIGYGDNYKKACDAKDWIAAYEIVNKIKEKMLYYKRTDADKLYKDVLDKYQEAERYVVLQECLTLIEDGDHSSLMHIAVVINEHKADYVYAELQKVARQMGNTELYESLVRMEDKVGKLEDQINAMSKEELEGTPRAPGTYDYYYSELYCPDSQNGSRASKIYSDNVKEFNQRSMSILTQAILLKKQDVAKRVVSIMRQNVEFVRTSEKGPKGGYMKVVYTWTDKSEAEKTLNQAIKNGDFN